MPLLRLVCLIAFFSTAGLAVPAHGEELVMNTPRFGMVHLYGNTTTPKSVALFISGDGGWELGVVQMARVLSRMDALVIGIDIRRYLQAINRSRAGCEYTAADLEMLSQIVQKNLRLESYHYPVLVGYSSGATLAYAAAVEAPPGVFLGAISLGFSPHLQIARPLCKGQGLHYQPGAEGKGIDLLIAPRLETRWVVLQGKIDQVCDAQTTIDFVAQIPSARVIVLPRVGHGFGVQSHWGAQFREAFAQLSNTTLLDAQSSERSLDDLPLVEVRAKTDAPATDYLAILLTGDGGWAGLDRELAGVLAGAGIPVVGLNSLKYFWSGRDAVTTARDVTRIARHYLAAWGKRHLLLIGYSFGADVLPLTVEKFPEELLEHVAMMTLVGPDLTGSFEFHLSDWIGGGTERGDPLRPVVERLHGSPPLLCIHGTEETNSLCRGLDPSLATTIELKGGHHFHGEYMELATLILARLPK